MCRKPIYFLSLSQETELPAAGTRPVQCLPSPDTDNRGPKIDEDKPCTRNTGLQYNVKLHHNVPIPVFLCTDRQSRTQTDGFNIMQIPDCLNHTAGKKNPTHILLPRGNVWYHGIILRGRVGSPSRRCRRLDNVFLCLRHDTDSH